MTLFHFNCCAVVAVEIMRDSDLAFNPEQDMIAGHTCFFTSREAAARWITETERLRKIAHEVSEADWKQQWGPLAKSHPLPEVFYAMIPLSELQADDLNDLQDKLEFAAKLQYVGVGRVA